MKRIASLLCLVALGACSAEKEPTISVDPRVFAFNDFEAVRGWGSDLSLLDVGRAHSGKYAIKVDKDHEFSLTYDLPLGQVSPHKFKTVHMDAWAFLPSDKATGMLGIQIMEPSTNQQTYGDGLRLGEVVKKYGEWVPVSKDFVLPDNITPVQHLRFSLWRADASDLVLVDDVKLSIKQ